MHLIFSNAPEKIRNNDKLVKNEMRNINFEETAEKRAGNTFY